MRMSRPASQLFTVVVGEGLNTIDFLYKKLQEDRGTGFYTKHKIAAAIGASPYSLAHTLAILSRHGVLHNKRGKFGGLQVTMEQLQKHTVLDVIYYLGQDVPDPAGDNLFERVKGRVYDLLNVPLIEYLQ